MKLPPQHSFKCRGPIDQCARCGKWSDELYGEVIKKVSHRDSITMDRRQVVLAYSYCLTDEELAIRDVLL